VLMSILYLANDYAMTAFFVRAAKRLFRRCVGPGRSYAMTACCMRCAASEQ
jgi:3-hydroxymyristoyl/3-hydroxydecanoyl-(acyl carrier protein) dehydratase